MAFAYAVHPQVLLQKRVTEWKVGRLKLAAEMAEGFMDKGEFENACLVFKTAARFLVHDCNDSVYSQVVARLAALDAKVPQGKQTPEEAVQW